MTCNLSRLFQPKSIAVIGGGAWCRSVTEQLQKTNYKGDIWPVHPRAEDICGLKSYPTALDLPSPPDAAFVGINRDATIGAVERLSRLGAGGAVCFASGFGETTDGQDANTRLLHAAGDMPILGPNCYGFINALDGASLWPDQHGCTPVQSGVAILTQSSNIAINLTMQKRGLPIAYMVTCGNQAQLSMAQVAESLLDDPRVTAIGLHIEGFSELAFWQSFARRAHARNVPVVALKVGKSTQAQAATISHTASLAGSDAGAQALLDHLGIARVDNLPTLIETLKILHLAGHLPSTRIASISCSGGEASLIADMAHATALTFPPLTSAQQSRLGKALGPKVALANPLDYHTYIWRNVEAMSAAFSAMIEPDLALTLLIVDFPREDTCDAGDWECVIQAAFNARAKTGGRIAMVATLPELMPEHVADRLMQVGIIPLNGLSEALAAALAAQPKTPVEMDLIEPTNATDAPILDEAKSKAILAQAGVTVPNGRIGPLADLAAFAEQSDCAFAIKSVKGAHKSETGGVALNLHGGADVRQAGSQMEGPDFLLEEMIEGIVAELLVGVVKDPAHGFILTIGAGGIHTEILNDVKSLLIPATRNQINQALFQLKTAPILQGHRNQPAADTNAVLDAIEAIQGFVLANLDTVEEVEVNPLLATTTHAVAADALIRKRHD